ncbi:MFS transporter [Alicyclobacillus pomorum]|uniref:MFS transporter n=1 Tax=Alicyclobacillus pomorum TaxID=204470 RepID=UPI0009FD9EE8|nr:MFS transporter [Alicyclobacillus pomorum]
MLLTHFSVAVLKVSLPLLVHRELMLSAVTLGLLGTAYSIGSILGSAVYGLMKTPKHQGIVMICMIIAWGASLLPMIWLHHAWTTVICMGLAGATFAVHPPMARTMVQLMVPTELQGRVFGIRSSLISVGVPLGSYLSGLASNWLHPSAIVGFTGGGVILLGILASTVQEFRSL